MEKNFGTLVAESIREGTTVKLHPGTCLAMATLRNPGLTDEQVNAGLQDLADVYLEAHPESPVMTTFTEMEKALAERDARIESNKTQLEQWGKQINEQAKDIERYMARLRQKDEQIENLKIQVENLETDKRSLLCVHRGNEQAITDLNQEIQEIHALFDLMGMKGEAAMTPAFRLKAHVFGKLKLEVAE